MTKVGKEYDVGVFFNEKGGQEKYEGIRRELEKLGLTVRSYEDFPAGGSRLGSRTQLIQKSWTVVLIVTDDFVSDGFNEFETELGLIYKLEEEKRPMIVPVDFRVNSKCPTILNNLNRIEGLQNEFDVIAAKIEGNVDDNKNLATAESEDKATEEPDYNSLPSGAREILKYTCKKLMDVFEMDKKMSDLHKELEMEMGSNSAQNQDGQTDWIELINKKIKENWKRGRSEGSYFTKKVRKKMMEKYPNEVKGLDGSQGHFCLAFLLLGNKTPLRDFKECANLAEYLDPEAILELLRKCPVFPDWNEEQGKVFDDLKSLRNNVAHGAVDESAETEKELVNSTADAALAAFDKLRPMWPAFQDKINKLRSTASNQRDAPDDTATAAGASAS